MVWILKITCHVLGILPRSTCAAYALIGGLFALLCNIARWNSRWAWDKNMITIIINIRVSSIAPEFHGSHVKTISNCCDKQLRTNLSSTDHTSKQYQIVVTGSNSGTRTQALSYRYPIIVLSQNPFRIRTRIFMDQTTLLAFLIFGSSKYSNIRLLQIFTDSFFL